MDKHPKIGVSRCLLGEACRYDGRHKFDPELLRRLAGMELFGVCPELECGLGCPREAMELSGDAAAPRLIGAASGRDYTGRMLGWLPGKLDEIAAAGLDLFILKARSPSCGIASARLDGDRRCDGLFVQALRRRFPQLPLYDEEHYRPDDGGSTPG